MIAIKMRWVDEDAADEAAEAAAYERKSDILLINRHVRKKRKIINDCCPLD